MSDPIADDECTCGAVPVRTEHRVGLDGWEYEITHTVECRTNPYNPANREDTEMGIFHRNDGSFDNAKFLEASIKKNRVYQQSGAMDDRTRAALRKHEKELKAELKAERSKKSDKGKR